MIEIHFAENDCQGNFSGRVHKIEIPEIVTFQNVNFEGQKIIRLSNKIKVHNRIFPYQNITEWVGNLAWNCYCFHDVEAAHLINYLWKSDVWGRENVDCEFAEHIDFAPILPADLAAFSSIHRYD